MAQIRIKAKLKPKKSMVDFFEKRIENKDLAESLRKEYIDDLHSFEWHWGGDEEWWLWNKVIYLVYEKIRKPGVNQALGFVKEDFLRGFDSSKWVKEGYSETWVELNRNYQIDSFFDVEIMDIA